MFSFKPEFISARVSQTVSTELHLQINICGWRTKCCQTRLQDKSTALNKIWPNAAVKVSFSIAAILRDSSQTGSADRQLGCFQQDKM